MKKFCVIDVDSGNINSIIRMGEEAGFDIDKVSDAKLLADYDVVLLPGIGRYDSFLGNIKEKGFLNFLSDKSNFQDRYLIGFCLGMQVLVNGSQEGSLQGLERKTGHPRSRRCRVYAERRRRPAADQEAAARHWSDVVLPHPAQTAGRR